MTFVRITGVFKSKDLRCVDLIFHENDGDVKKVTLDIQ